MIVKSIQENGICSQLPGFEIKCICLAGYTGTFCTEKINYCLSQPCANGGTCVSSSTGLTCKCPFNHTGEFCHIRRYACDSS